MYLHIDKDQAELFLKTLKEEDNKLRIRMNTNRQEANKLLNDIAQIKDDIKLSYEVLCLARKHDEQLADCVLKNLKLTNHRRAAMRRRSVIITDQQREIKCKYANLQRLKQYISDELSRLKLHGDF